MDDFTPGMTPEQKEEFDKSREERLKLGALMKSVFSTQEGKAVLLHLRSIYVENCRFNPNLDVLNSIRWGFIREGQSMVVQSIEDCISFFEKEIKEQKKNG